MNLTRDAKSEIMAAGLTLRAYARSMQWADNAEGRWYGDACGCPDDRCIGYHHEEGENCGCLTSLLARALDEPPQPVIVPPFSDHD